MGSYRAQGLSFPMMRCSPHTMNPVFCSARLTHWKYTFNILVQMWHVGRVILRTCHALTNWFGQPGDMFTRAWWAPKVCFPRVGHLPYSTIPRQSRPSIDNTAPQTKITKLRSIQTKYYEHQPGSREISVYLADRDSESVDESCTAQSP